MKDELKTKVKAVWDEVKIPIIVVGTGIGAFILGSKYTEGCFARGMMRFHDAGVFKFFNPETGLEVTAEEAVKVLTDMKKSGKI